LNDVITHELLTHGVLSAYNNVAAYIPFHIIGEPTGYLVHQYSMLEHTARLGVLGVQADVVLFANIKCNVCWPAATV
jgi:hypothetical protein